MAQSRSRALALLLLPLILLPFAAAAETTDLARAFTHPPDSAKPWVYWFWLNSNITREGITADLEAMKRVGIGGVLIMEVDQGAPVGPVPFAGEKWRELFRRVVSEAHRLGLEVNMNNDAGWCGSGGPWITPDLAMQRVVWTETQVEGPKHVEIALPQPSAVADFYRDIATLAVPAPADPARIVGAGAKAVFGALDQPLAATAEWPVVESDRTVPRGRVLDLTARLGADGRLAWDVPEGKWTLLRFGHTPTGARNQPAPASGQGLECDKLSKQGAEAQFRGLMGKLCADSKSLVGQDKALVATHIDSWEVGVQNWTQGFREEFKQRRGYDLLPFLPVMTGRVVGNVEVSERFLWDLRQTISELLLDSYAGHFRDLAHEQGLRLTIEAYHTCPVDEFAYAGRADEPMGEFWSWGKYGAAFSCTEMTSAAHVYGKRIVGAEAFTASNGERWLGHPGNLKDLGDWAFCEGINRFVFHRYALQPWAGPTANAGGYTWLDRPPGMSMGPWGLHYERTQTWWEQSGAWHEYLARCQYLLQQGLFVADLCLLAPEGSPQTLNGQRLLAGKSGLPLDRPGHNFDVCPAEVVFTRMSVKDGRLVLPDGMSYRLLALPQVETMTPRLLRGIKELVAAGATVVGAPPVKSPSLSDYPNCDREVKDLVGELWGSKDAAEQVPQAAQALDHSPSPLLQRSYGKGRVIWGGAFAPRRETADAPPRLGPAKWLWLKEANPAAAAQPGTRYFRCVVAVEPGRRVASARLAMTADNSFECWINGRRAGSGDRWDRTYVMNAAPLLKPGENVIAVAATNGTDTPNPAGLIGALKVRYAEGPAMEVCTDHSWQAAPTVPDDWRTNTAPPADWSTAMELGGHGMEPWGDVEQAATASELYPDLDALGRLLAGMGVPPDFAYQPKRQPGSLRYIHRRLGGPDVYFVANQNSSAEEALCSFRVTRRRPELWWPDSGRLEGVAVYDEADGCTRVPLQLDSFGSVFVVFRAGAAAEPDRITSVGCEGEPLLDTAWRAEVEPPADNNAGVTNTFAMAVWAKPAADTLLPRETNSGVVGLGDSRNDALYPPPGHEVYPEPNQAGCGLSVGRNGVCVFEHGADYFAPVLVHAVPLTDWTHVAVVYCDGQPSLFLNGRFAHKGLRSTFAVHPGVGVRHGRGVAPFKGALGEFQQFDRALDAGEVAELMQTMPRPRGGGSVRAVRLVRLVRPARREDRTTDALVSQSGAYTLTTANGARTQLTVAAVPQPISVTGTWDVRFPPNWGAPEHVALDNLISWSDHPDPGVKHFSGTATYWKVFTFPARLLVKERRWFLDLGAVAVLADVTLNDKHLSTLWKAPFRVDVTDALQPGDNTLRIRVTNLWVNRQLGDEQLLPEDSDRNPNGTLKRWPNWLNEGKPSPTGRFTFTSWRLWGKDGPLVESGLLGPVMLHAAEVRSIAPPPGR